MFSVAPGTLTALSNRNDDRAYWVFSGDLSQMGTIETFLRERGFPVVKCDVYPGFVKADKDKYIEALRLVWEHRINGWWSQETDLLKHGICTSEEFGAALKRA